MIKIFVWIIWFLIIGGYASMACGIAGSVIGAALFLAKKKEKSKLVFKYSAGIFVTGILFLFIILILGVAGILDA